MGDSLAVLLGTILFSTTFNLIQFLEASWITPHVNPKPWPRFTLQQRTAKYVQDNYLFQGKSFAGRTEFPWLAEIRYLDTEDWLEQENWANANLITSRHALTTCLAVAEFELADKGSLGGTGVKNQILKLKDSTQYKLLYSDDYPYKITYKREDLVGTRLIKEFHPHPSCSFNDMDYHWAIVEIKGRPINPYPPYTSYMPVELDPAMFTNMKLEFVKPDNRKDFKCWVALWARENSDDVNFPVDQRWTPIYLLDHKIKYKVIWVDPQLCKDNRHSYPEMISHQKVYNLECMGLDPSEKMGEICDHDRGAPVVCDGITRAIVLTGALEYSCNKTQPLPFVVIDIQYAFPFYSNLNARVFRELSLKPFGQRSGCSSLGFEKMTVNLVLLCIYLINEF